MHDLEIWIYLYCVLVSWYCTWIVSNGQKKLVLYISNPAEHILFSQSEPFYEDFQQILMTVWFTYPVFMILTTEILFVLE